MAQYRFQANVVVEGSSEEDALRQIGGRIIAVARHLGDGDALADSEPFFTLSGDARGEPTDMSVDPIVAERGPTPQPEEVPTPEEDHQ